MKRKYGIIILISGLVLAFSIANAQGQDAETERIMEIIQSAPPAAQFPNASAVTLLQEDIVTVNPDYSMQTEEHMVIKILNDLGKARYGDQKRRFDKNTDSIEVVLARTFDKDMNIVEVEEKAINVTTPMALAGASMYSNILQKVVSFPALEGGVSIELKLIKYSKAPEEGEKTFIWETDLFQASDPILSKKHQLIHPLGTDISYTVQNEGLDYSQDTVDNRAIHTWKTTFAQQIIPEPNMPPFERVAPRLIYTSAKSWEEVGNWFADNFYKHIKADENLKKWIGKLKEEYEGKDELIKKIALFAIQDVREIQLGLGLSGYEPHDAYQAFENKYGDYLDKTALLVTLLKEAGIVSYPVFINENEAITAEDLPSLKQFTGMFVYIPREGKEPLWVNTFADHCPFGYFPHGQGSTCLLIKEDGSELITAFDPPPQENLLLSKTEYRLDANGNVDGKIALKMQGYFDFLARLNLRGKKPSEIEQYFQRTASNISLGSESEDYSMTDPESLTVDFEISLSFTSPELGIIEKDMMIFEMPGSPFSFISFPYPSLEMRFYDYMVKSKMLLSHEGDIILPDGYEVAYMPSEISLSDDYCELEFKFVQDETGKIIHFSRDMKMKQKIVPVDNYFEFKELFDEFFKRQNRIFLLEKI